MISQQDHLKLLEQSIVEGNLEPNDQISVAKAVYGRRRRNHPPLPKSLEETHENLSKMNIQTSNGED